MYQIYWNLHKNAFSVSNGQHVLGHTRNALLHNVTFRVRETGRQTVIEQKRKNVHAFICTNEIFDVTKWDSSLFLPADYVTYNPYKHKTFVRGKDEFPITESEWVYLSARVSEEGDILPNVLIGVYTKPHKLSVANESTVKRRLERCKLQLKK